VTFQIADVTATLSSLVPVIIVVTVATVVEVLPVPGTWYQVPVPGTVLYLVQYLVPGSSK